MLFCHRPYDHLYVGKDGKTRCCSWVKHSLGNLIDSDIKEIWNGEKAREIRSSIEDRSFRFCDANSCPLIGNNLLPDLTHEQFQAEKMKWQRETPRDFNLAYDFICNHACPSCRDGIFKPTELDSSNAKTIANKLGKTIQKAHRIQASGNGDLFSSKHMLELFSNFKPSNPDCHIHIETNASLAERRWHHIEHLEKHRLSIIATPNSLIKSTYDVLAGNVQSYENTMRSLRFLGRLRKAERIKEYKITIVVQDTNYKELPSFIEKCLDDFDPDLVQIRIIKPWFDLSLGDFNRKNILSPSHPGHQDFLEVLKNPICSHPKVFHWNDLDNQEPSDQARAFYLSTIKPCID